MASTRASRFVFPTVLLLGFAIVVALVALVRSSEDASAHTTTVPERPRRDLPTVLDGTVYDMAHVGNRVYVVGNFTQIALQDGTVVDQPSFFAYDADDGTYLSDIAPLFENGSIRAIEPTPDGTHLVIGGSFTRVDGRWRNRVAKLDLDGEVDRIFVADVDSEVEALDVDAERVYVGGNFETVGGIARSRLAAVDAATGAVDTGFDFPITEPSAFNNANGAVKALDITPDGSRLVVVYNALKIAGEDRVGVAQIGLGPTPTLLPWQTDLYATGRTEGCISSKLWMRDMDISPNGKYFVIVTSGHDAPPACDTSVALPIEGEAGVEALWVTRMFDSTFSVGISDFAVYVGGHFCYTEGPGAPDFGFDQFPKYRKPAACQTGTADANVDSPPWVARRQVAALDPATGWALEWDPGTNAQVAVFALEVTDRGLLLGHDQDRVNQVDTGRHAFFDFGPLPDATPPAIKIQYPAQNNDVAETTMTLAGTATDEHRVDAVTVRLQNRDTNTYLQADGTMQAAASTLPAAVTASEQEISWSLDVTNLPPGEYFLDVKATDRSGNETTDWKRRKFTIPFADASCSVSLTANGNPALSWSPVAGVSSWSIRRDGAWRASIDNAFSWVDEGTAPGTYTYVLRYRDNGQQVDLPCGDGPVTVEPDIVEEPPAQCWVNVNADTVTLTWTNINKAKNQSLRRDGQWVASLGDVVTTTDTVADGTYNYVIRYTIDGTKFDIDCGDVTVVDDTPPQVLECTATANGSDVTLTWTAVDGEDRYTLRRDGRWTANLGATTTHVDSGVAAGEHTYVIRFKQNGVNVDIDCGSVTVA